MPIRCGSSPAVCRSITHLALLGLFATGQAGAAVPGGKVHLAGDGSAHASPTGALCTPVSKTAVDKDSGTCEPAAARLSAAAPHAARSTAPGVPLLATSALVALGAGLAGLGASQLRRRAILDEE